MTGYGLDDFLREQRKKKEEEKQKSGNFSCKCPVCGEPLEHPGQYHSDECDIIVGFARWCETNKENSK